VIHAIEARMLADRLPIIIESVLKQVTDSATNGLDFVIVRINDVDADIVCEHLLCLEFVVDKSRFNDQECLLKIKW